jgi:hypothetical protein
MQGHCEGLDCARAQPNAFRPVEHYLSVVSPTYGLRGQLGLDQFVEGDPVFFRPKEEPVRAAQNSKAVLKAGPEIAL